MKLKRICYTVRGSLISLGLSVTAWSQVPVAVDNAGFEDDILDDGIYDATGPAGWTGGYTDAADGFAIWYDDGSYKGVYNPEPPLGDFGGVVPEGDNAAWAESYAGYRLGMRQILTEVLLPSATYDLSVKVGNPDVTIGNSDYRIELLAGGTEVMAVTGPAPTPGNPWITVSLPSYTAPALGDPLIGQALEIRLLSADIPVTGNRVHYDDVSLVRTTVTDPTALAGGPYVVPGGSSLSLDGSASIPPDGETIVSWEWELDGDDDFNDATGANPPAISGAVLTSTWGMSFGANPIKLRVTGSNSATSIANATVNVSPDTPIGIPVPNSGFELPSLAEGTSSPVPSAPTDWTGGYYPGGGTPVTTDWTPESGYRGTYNPDLLGGGDYSAEGIPEGDHVAYVEYYAGYYMGLSQVLSDTMFPDTVYSLGVEIGNPDLINGGGAIANYRVELLAGDTRIAEATGTSPAPGEWATVTLPAYQAPSAGDPILDEPLEIRIMVVPSGPGAELHFDNVQLSRSPLANPVSVPGGPYFVGSAGSLTLDGGGSAASGTGSITLYEWDLDNDGSYDVTGESPAAIPFATLVSTWNMALGSNTVGLRVTDSAALTATGTTTVFLLTETILSTGGSNSWTTGTWSGGLPTNGIDATIAAGVAADANGVVPTWIGALKLGPGSSLAMTGETGEFIPIDGASSITLMNATIFDNFKTRTIAADIILDGGGAFASSSNAGWNNGRTFTGVISGNGGLSISGENQMGYIFNSANPFTGGLVFSGGNRYGVQFNATGAAGAGDVTVNPSGAVGASNSAVLVVNAPNPFATTATLTLNGAGWNNSSGGFGPFAGPYDNSVIRIDMKNDATVEKLIIDNIEQNAGTYTGTDGDWITGTGTLTVTSGTAPDPPTITKVEFDGSGNLILTLDTPATGLTVEASELLFDAFLPLATTIGPNPDQLTISLIDLDPNEDGKDFFRVVR